MVPASRNDSTHHDGGGDQEHLDDGEPLGLDHVVDVAALRRQHQRAAHGAEALDRHRDRDDDFAAVVDRARCCACEPVERLRHFLG